MSSKISSSKFSKERFFWIGFSVVLIIVILILLLKALDYKRRFKDSQDSFDYKRRYEDSQNYLMSIQQSASEREKMLSEDIRSLKEKLQNYGVLAHFTGLSLDGLSYKEVEELQRKGLKDPVNDLITDLRKHRELIPYEGILGGTMDFYTDESIHVLSSKNVLAYFEDGHICGYMLLEYHVSNGEISWKVIDSRLD